MKFSTNSNWPRGTTAQHPRHIVGLFSPIKIHIVAFAFMCVNTRVTSEVCKRFGCRKLYNIPDLVIFWNDRRFRFIIYIEEELWVIQVFVSVHVNKSFCF